jgi:hypothetical protein
MLTAAFYENEVGIAEVRDLEPFRPAVDGIADTLSGQHRNHVRVGYAGPPYEPCEGRQT